MNYVQPIRDKDKIENMKRVLLEANQRDYILFLLGINTGMRISDMLRLRVRDALGDFIVIKEQKTGKANRYFVPPHIKKDLHVYMQDMEYDDFLFQGRKGYNTPITRQRAYEVLQNAARVVGLREVGTHTMRKTFGYHLYKQTKDVVLLMQIFKHSDPSVTLRYIGINEDSKETALRRFRL